MPDCEDYVTFVHTERAAAYLALGHCENGFGGRVHGRLIGPSDENLDLRVGPGRRLVRLIL